jgi:dTDP-4-dehydrorhamnose 3,5-epimerase
MPTVTRPRGSFARNFCLREYETRGLDGRIVQINSSLSLAKGTLRGMHYQLPPKAETKIIRCIRGAVYDVILDIRPGSPTFGRHFAAELDPDNLLMMYVPKGFAHGFLTLASDCEVLYLVTEFYSPPCERTIRWDDPKFAIQWPFQPSVLSDKDKTQPDFDPAYHLGAQ